MQINFFDSIIVPLPKAKVYGRLGYSESKTQLKQEQRDKVEKYIEEALAFINLGGAGARVPIHRIDSSEIVLSEGITFRSKSLAELLNNCNEALFMGVTAGKEVSEAIQNDSLGKNVSRAVIFDAVASEMVEAGLKWVMNYFNRKLIRENMHITERRFSAGYGDFLLDNQKIICDTLDLDRLGVVLTKDYILRPEKSVTAIAGVRGIGHGA